MKIDNVLCRKLLEAIEDDPQAGSGTFLTLKVVGDQKQIAHHLKYLLDAKLISGQDVTSLEKHWPDIAVRDITPTGRNFLAQLKQADQPVKQKPKIGFTS